NPGGVLIKDATGNSLGACGISGDTSDKDEMCAVAGIEAAGLKADPGKD
ncbi:MAG: heme-binding protein, partial [Pseudomonadota bacterium]